jgi:HK97 family phage major capsid protein
MAMLLELKKQRETALAKSESIIAAAESAGNRQFTDGERTELAAANAEVTALNPQIEGIETANSLRLLAPKGQIMSDPRPNPATEDPNGPRAFSKEYASAFQAWTRSRGESIAAAMAEGADELGGFQVPVRRTRGMQGAVYEGAPTSGGYAVPSQVSGDFVPLAPPEMGVYNLIQVVPTTMDTKYVRKDAIGTATAKAESGGSTNSFTESDPAIGQFTLTANMMGRSSDASWELLQDVGQFAGFLDDDILLSIAVLRESWILSGTGTGQAQGLLGNVGAGLTGVLTGADNYASELFAATLSIQGVLNAAYHDNATFLMARQTAIVLRQAQVTANLYEKRITRIGTTWFLDGYPLAFSSAMPVIGSATTPVLFGDFRKGYIYGERGGAGVNIKILDQPKAINGLLTILGYQRVDGRVRRTEAIQPIVLHS